MRNILDLVKDSLKVLFTKIDSNFEDLYQKNQELTENKASKSSVYTREQIDAQNTETSQIIADLGEALELTNLDVLNNKKAIEEVIAGGSSSEHDHDDRYYTKDEIDIELDNVKNELNEKAPSDHTHIEFNTLSTEISNVKTELNKKANSNHTHSEFGTTLIGTLTTGNTDITLTDDSINKDSTIDIYTSAYGVNPKTIAVSDGSVTLTFKAQAEDMSVKVVIK